MRQRTPSDSSIQGDRRAGRISGDAFLAVVLASHAWRRPGRRWGDSGREKELRGGTSRIQTWDPCALKNTFKSLLFTDYPANRHGLAADAAAKKIRFLFSGNLNPCSSANP
jgi:hypothetical protein